MSLNLLILRSDFQWLHHFLVLLQPFMCLLKCQFYSLRVNTDHFFSNFIRSFKLYFICEGLNKEFMHALQERFLLLCDPESTHSCKYFTGLIDRGLSLKSLLTEIELVTTLYNHDHLTQKLTKEFFFTHYSLISHIQVTMLYFELNLHVY